MATLWVSEFRGNPSAGAISNNGVPSFMGASNQVIGLGSSASTGQLGAQTNFVGLQSDVGCWVSFGSTTSTAVASSTQGFRVPANAPPIFGAVTPGSRLTAIST